MNWLKSECQKYPQGKLFKKLNLLNFTSEYRLIHLHIRYIIEILRQSLFCKVIWGQIRGFEITLDEKFQLNRPDIVSFQFVMKSMSEITIVDHGLKLNYGLLSNSTDAASSLIIVHFNKTISLELILKWAWMKKVFKGHCLEIQDYGFRAHLWTPHSVFNHL